MIISISRRCDIPRFQFDWFLERLNAGFVDVANPFNAAQVKRVSLAPGGGDEASVLVFWTRDPWHILAHEEELTKRGFHFYVMVTVTGYPVELEPGMPKAQNICTAMKRLALKIGPERVIWRYDPVFVSSITDEGFHRRNFDELSQMLSGSVRRVIISLYDEYRGAKQRIEALEKTGILQMGQHNAANLADLLTSLAESACAAGMEIQSCAETESLESFGIKSGACIDAALIRELWGLEFTGKDKNQRPACLCCKSVDIGRYRSCQAGCRYCYAW